jgi:DNA-directed RNA polymerase subunit RPC12/RpoP
MLHNVNTSIGKMPRPPKNGKGALAVPGSKYCKGICVRLKSKRPYLIPYSTHYHCTRCDYWANKDILTDKNKCPCCNYRPRMKAWRNRGRLVHN